MSQRCRFLPVAFGVAIIACAAGRAAPPGKDDPGRDGPRRDRYGDPLPRGAVARLGTLRLGPESGWEPAGYSSDGKLVATISSQDNGVQLWDGATGKLLRLLPAEVAGDFIGPALLADGSRVAAVSQERSVRVWDTFSGKELRRFLVRGTVTGGLVFCRDGTTLAARCYDDVVHWWDVPTGKLMREWNSRVAFRDLLKTVRLPAQLLVAPVTSPDGRTVATHVEYWQQGRDKGSIPDRCFVTAWDAARGRELWRHNVKPRCNGPLVFSADGRFLAVGQAGDEFLVWEVGSGKRVGGVRAEDESADESAVALALSADGATLAAGWPGWSVTLWDVTTGKLLRRIRGDAEAEFAPSVRMGLSGDGRRLAVCAVGRARLWDTTTGREVPRFEGHGGRVEQVGFSPDGRSLGSTSWGEYYRWDTATWRETGRSTMAPVRRAEPLSVEPGVGQFLAQDKDGRLALHELASGKVLRALPVRRGRWHGGILSQDGKAVILQELGEEDVFAVVFDAATGKQSRRAVLKYQADGMTSPDGNTVAWSADTETGPGTCLWDAAGKVRLLSKPDPSPFESTPHHRVAVSPGGRYLASSYPRMRLWDAKGRPLVGLEEAPGDQQVFSLVFSPDGKMVAGGLGYDLAEWAPERRFGRRSSPLIGLWESTTGRLRAKLSGHRGIAASLTFSPDGRLLASGSSDTTVLVWDVYRQRDAGARREERLSEETLGSMWEDLAEMDAARAYRAICTLIRSPSESVPFLAGRLRPVAAPSAGRVERLVADLDSRQFAARQRTARELEELQEVAEPALRKALAGAASLEYRRRVERLLEALHAPVPPPERLRQLRALEVLEAVNTPEARRLLEGLANGAPTARLTREARASLDRLRARAAAGK